MVKTPHEEKILSWLKKYPANEVLFHHRWPTSTANVKNAAHPFSTKDFFDTQYILVHNGVLWSEDVLFKAHSEIGINYSSMQPTGEFNDSEALLWDVALYLEGKQEALEANGSIAFICMALNKEHGDKLYFARNAGSPLNMTFNKKRLMLSSEGKGQSIQPDKLYCYDYATNKMSLFDLEIPEHYNYTPAIGYHPNEYQGYKDGYAWQNAFDEDEDKGYYDGEGKFHYFDYGVTDSTFDSTDLDGWGASFSDPNDEDISYDKKLDKEIDPKVLEASIKDYVRKYLKEAGGYYTIAYQLIVDEMEGIAGGGYDFDQYYREQALQGAKIALYGDPMWDHDDLESLHPDYSLSVERIPSTAPTVDSQIALIGEVIDNHKLLTRVADSYSIKQEKIKDLA